MASPSLLGDKAAILSQLDRILSSSVFRNSKRHSSLLRYLVEKTLAGEASQIKERTLGVEVFGRPADYDNYSDPVVRISAGEIRKRIAQYYHESGREKELRIELPLGSYVPEFLDPASSLEVPSPALDGIPPVQMPLQAKRKRGLLRPWPMGLLAGLVVIVGSLGFGWHRRRSTGFEGFWQPFVAGATPATLCISRVMLPPGNWNAASGGSPVPAIAPADAVALARITGQVQVMGGHYQIRRDDQVTFDDLRRGPTVLIGGFNDIWAIRLTETLRFIFRHDGQVPCIQDRFNPAQTWNYAPARTRTRDYAVVTRLLAPQSGQPVMIIAGLGGNGTEIAAEFVTNRVFFEELSRRAPGDWQKKNLQVVLETQVINGNSGPPSIVTLHTW